MQLTTDHIKNLLECCSKDTTRYELCGIHLKLTGATCTLESTDGWIAIQYKDVDLESVRSLIGFEYGISLSVKEGDCILYLDNKLRKKLKKRIVDLEGRYPNMERIIPDLETATCRPCELPIFNIDLLVRVKKITGQNQYLPDYWNGVHGATVKEIYGGILLVMPGRILSDTWRHGKARDKFIAETITQETEE